MENSGVQRNRERGKKVEIEAFAEGLTIASRLKSISPDGEHFGDGRPPSESSIHEQKPKLVMGMTEVVA